MVSIGLLWVYHELQAAATFTHSLQTGTYVVQATAYHLYGDGLHSCHQQLAP